jgi:hypothetical protein
VPFDWPSYRLQARKEGAQPDGPEYWLHHGVWHCFERGAVVHAGLGYTPESAHADWLRMKHKYPEAQADSCVQLKG